jgi:hypothetical protein
LENKPIPIFPAFFFPNVEYFMFLSKYDTINIEICENFPKQTFRNRTYILSSNGLLGINVPIVKEKTIKQKFSDTRISYTENWNVKAWRTITSAYGKSIYFEYFEDEIKQFFTSEHEKLIDLNIKILHYFIKRFDISTKIEFTQSYTEVSPEYDFRNKFLVNKKAKESKVKFTPYIQCFSEKFPFRENLSCIDLLMNTGKESNLIINF